MTENEPTPKYLDRDVACRRCGYNLRGLPELGRCPECHAPVILALLPPDVPVVDPAWVERIAQGCRLATRALFGGMLVSTGLELIGIYSPRLAVPLGIVVAASALSIIIYGLWLATEPPVHAVDTDAGVSARSIARIALILWPITLLVVAGVVRTQGWRAGLVPLGIGSPVGLAGVVGAWCFCVHTQRIAELIRDPLTTNRAKVYRIWFAISWGALATGAVGLPLSGRAAFGALCGIGALGVLAFGFLTLGLASYLADFLPHYLAAAKANWEKADAEAQR